MFVSKSVKMKTTFIFPKLTYMCWSHNPHLSSGWSMKESTINLKFMMFTDVGQVCFWFWKFDLVNIARYCFFACSLLRIIFQNFCALVKFFRSLFKKQFLEDGEHVLGLLFAQWFDYTECVCKGFSWLTFMRKFIFWSLKATQYSSLYEQWDFFI